MKLSELSPEVRAKLQAQGVNVLADLNANKPTSVGMGALFIVGILLCETPEFRASIEALAAGDFSAIEELLA